MTVFARDIFLFTVYARGMRSDDIFRLTSKNIQDGQLTYRQHITGREISFPWDPAMQEIADRYKQKGMTHLFPVITTKDPHEQWRQYDGILHRINYSLKKLGERTRSRLSAEPYSRKAFMGEHDEGGKHKRTFVNF